MVIFIVLKKEKRSFTMGTKNRTVRTTVFFSADIGRTGAGKPSGTEGRLDDIFRQTVLLLNEEGLVSLRVQYIDGTKLESAANRYTFVWRGSMEKNKSKLESKVEAVFRTAEEVLAIEDEDAVSLTIIRTNKKEIGCNLK